MAQGKKASVGPQFASDLPPFVPIVKGLLLDASISPTAKVVWAFVQERSWDDNRDPWDETELAYGAFASMIGVGEVALRSAVKELVERGWLTTWRRGQGSPNGYCAHSTLQEPQDLKRRNHVSRNEETNGLRAGASTEGELDKRLDKTVAVAKRPRKRNLPFDAFVKCGADEAVDKGKILAALKKLRGLPDYKIVTSQQGRDEAEQVLADEIVRRSGLYRERWPEIEWTPTGLANNWAQVLQPKPRSKSVARKMYEKSLREENE